jgi:hypothetical protein
MRLTEDPAGLPYKLSSRPMKAGLPYKLSKSWIGRKPET